MVQQRVSFNLGFDKGLQLNRRHLQQLDCLLQLGRHDQGLTLLHDQSLGERHYTRLASIAEGFTKIIPAHIGIVNRY